MKKTNMAALCAALAGLAAAADAGAQDAIKVGLIAPMSGPFATMGQHMENGLRAYLRQHGDTVAGKKIEIVVKDEAPGPDATRRLAQELVTRDKVDYLAGFALTPDAFAAASVATAAKKPMLVLNAATHGMTSRSPYMVRTSYTQPQVCEPLGRWAVKNGFKKVYTLVADYAPGVDAETSFSNAYKAAGGALAGQVRVALSSRDYAAYLQRIKDARPDAVFVFLPTGEPMNTFMKQYQERGLDKAGIKVLATEWADDDTLRAIGKASIGVISTGFYSTAHNGAANRAFLKAYAAAGTHKLAPDFMAAAAYDGMALIVESAKKLNGNIDGEKAVALMKGMKLDSPRGPLTIEAATRDPIQNIYVRKVELIKGKLTDVEFDTIANVKQNGAQ